MNRLKIDPDYANPRAALGSIGTLGELGGRRVTLGTMRAFNAIDDKASLSPTGIVDFLIEATVETPDGAKLTEEAVQGLEPADRAHIVSTLINLHDNWFDDSADATGIGPRSKGESEEEYLARGFQATNDDFLASSKRITEAIKRSTAGLGDAWKSKLLPGLTANTAASDRVGSILSSMARKPLFGDRQSYEPRALPEIPPHPAHRTNALLEDLADRIGDMQQLALATGEMQQSLNDTARAAVEKFSEGAEASSKATEDGLELSRNSLDVSKNGFWVAVGSLVIAVIAIVVSIYFSIAQNSESSAWEQAAAVQSDRLIATERRLAAALEANTKLTAQIAAAASAPKPPPTANKKRSPKSRQ